MWVGFPTENHDGQRCAAWSVPDHRDGKRRSSIKCGGETRGAPERGSGERMFPAICYGTALTYWSSTLVTLPP